MNKKRGLFSLVSLSIILAFLYQASSFIPLSEIGGHPFFKGVSPLISSLVSFAAEPKPQKVELTDKRTERSKTFLNPSGSFTTEVSQEPINYKDQEGKIKSINTSLVQDPDGFKITENSLAVDFNSVTDKLFTIQIENGSSSLNYKILDSAQSSIQPILTA